jgi:hypothetical protein
MSPTRLAVLELFFTVGMPALILQFGASTLGPVGVVVAAAVPAGLFFFGQMVVTRTVSVLAVFALVAVALSGVVAFLRLDATWFAWKEGLLPVVLGLAVAASTLGPWPALKPLLDKVLDPAALAQATSPPEAARRFAQVVRHSTLELAIATAAPGLLAFAMARILVVSEAGTPEFADELGQYAVWSVPGVWMPGVVVTVMWFRRMMAQVEVALGVEFEALLPEL